MIANINRDRYSIHSQEKAAVLKRPAADARAEEDPASPCTPPKRDMRSLADS